MHDERNDSGATAIEYALLVTAIAAVIVTMVFLLGGQVAGLFGDSCDHVQSNLSGAASCS